MNWEQFDPPFNTAVLNPTVTAAGTTQADATQLDALTSIVTTAPPGSGVKLIRPAKYRQIVVNSTSNQLNVYPRSGMAIVPNAANQPVVVQPGRTFGFIVTDDTVAYTIFNSSSFG